MGNFLLDSHNVLLKPVHAGSYPCSIVPCTDPVCGALVLSCRHATRHSTCAMSISLMRACSCMSWWPASPAAEETIWHRHYQHCRRTPDAEAAGGFNAAMGREGVHNCHLWCLQRVFSAYSTALWRCRKPTLLESSLTTSTTVAFSAVAVTGVLQF